MRSPPEQRGGGPRADPSDGSVGELRARRGGALARDGPHATHLCRGVKTCHSKGYLKLPSY